MDCSELLFNEPVYHEGSGTGVVVLHGFTGSPRSLQEYAVRLADAGYTVALPRLTGHCSCPEEMEKAQWVDWTKDAEAAFRWVSGRAERVFTTGLSMGGTLALWLAERHQDLAGVITVNAALRFPHEWLMRVAGAMGVPRWVKGVGNDIREPGQDEHCYDRIPLRAARELALLMAEVRRNLGCITCPALIFSSVNDHVVPPQNQKELYAALRSQDKRLVTLENSFHVATMDYDRDVLYTQALAFIAEHAGQVRCENDPGGSEHA